jgi:hypothetical protein
MGQDPEFCHFCDLIEQANMYFIEPSASDAEYIVTMFSFPDKLVPLESFTQRDFPNDTDFMEEVNRAIHAREIGFFPYSIVYFFHTQRHSRRF